jgi:uncharacterized delta-60 repeat protein
MSQKKQNDLRMFRPSLERLEQRDTPAMVGTLDPRFGTDGTVSYNLGGSDYASAATTDSAGRIILAGLSTAPTLPDFLIVRLNPDGSLDTTFGSGGKQVVDFFGGADYPMSVAVDPSGNIVVGGYRTAPVAPFEKSVAVARLLPGGTLDTGFGLNGKVVLPVTGSNIEADAVLPDSSGGVVVAGTLTTAGTAFFSIGRLTNSGAIDNSFGTAGNITFDFGAGSNSHLSDAILDSNGNIVVVGSMDNGGIHRFAAARLTSSGAIDASFGTGGKTKFSIGVATDDTATRVHEDANGRLFLVGNTVDGTLVSAALACLRPTGALDTGFATGGIFVTDGGLYGADALIQSSGRIVVGGTVQTTSGTQFILARLTQDGVFDQTFNPAGKFPGLTTVQFSGSTLDACRVLLPGVDERILAVGNRSNAPGGMEVARLFGTVEKGALLVVGGTTTGTALGYKSNSFTGEYQNMPAGAGSPFGPVAVTIRTATADVNGDGAMDAILVTGPGTPVRFAVIDGSTGMVIVPSTAPFAGSEDFTGGGYVAGADLDGDGRAEIVVTPDQGGGPRVTIFSVASGTPTVRSNFFGIDDPNFRGGCRAALGDINGDGIPDLIVAAGFLGGPRVSTYAGYSVLGTPTHMLKDFFAFPGSDAVTLRNGIFVALGDVNGDGLADLIFGGGPGGAPRVYILNAVLFFQIGSTIESIQAHPLANFFVAGNAFDRGGVRLAVKDADGDHKSDVVAGSGEGAAARARIYLGKNVTSTTEPMVYQDLTVFGGVALPGGVFVG